jgi:hypothetical protein
MKTDAEVREMRAKFDKQYNEYEDNDELDAILSTLNWVLEASDELESYLSV